MKFRKLKNISLSLCSILLVASCANFIETNQSMGSWLGEDINTVIQNWGYPDEEKTIAGKKLIVWNSERVIQDVDYIPSYGSRFNGNGANRKVRYNRIYTNYTGKCSRILEIDKNNKIIGWDIKGDDCAYLDGISMANPKSELVQNIKDN